MGKVIVGFIAAAFVFAGWRNLPPIEQPSAFTFGFIAACVVVLAFLLGRRSVRAEAVAVAVATAQAEAAAAAHAGAQAHSSVVVNVGGEAVPGGARAVAEQMYGRPSWIGPARVDLEQIEGSDAVEGFLEEYRLDVAEQEALRRDS